MIKIKRVYDPPEKEDGYRVLVDRLWPRGLSKDKARVDLWLKELAPSDKLRKWFSHDPKRWVDFEKQYRKELKDKEALLRELREIEREKKKVTLLYAAKDPKHNNAVVLRDVLENYLS